MLFQALKIYTISRCTYKDYIQLSGVAPVADLDPTIRRDNLPVPPSKNEIAVSKGKAVQGKSPHLSYRWLTSLCGSRCNTCSVCRDGLILHRKYRGTRNDLFITGFRLLKWTRIALKSALIAITIESGRSIWLVICIGSKCMGCGVFDVLGPCW